MSVTTAPRPSVQFPERSGCGGLGRDVVAWRRKRRVLARVTRAAWRLEQAEQERAWALAAARAEGALIREIAAAAGLSSSRVHQVVTDADLDALDAALGVLRSAGWPAPEDPEVEDGDLAGRADIAGRLDDEVEWIRQCADWLEDPVPRAVPDGGEPTSRVGLAPAIPCHWTCPVSWPSCGASPTTSTSWPIPPHRRPRPGRGRRGSTRGAAPTSGRARPGIHRVLPSPQDSAPVHPTARGPGSNRRKSNGYRSCVYSGSADWRRRRRHGT